MLCMLPILWHLAVILQKSHSQPGYTELRTRGEAQSRDRNVLYCLGLYVFNEKMETPNSKARKKNYINYLRCQFSVSKQDYSHQFIQFVMWFISSICSCILNFAITVPAMFVLVFGIWVAYFLAVDLKRFYQFWVVYQLMGRVWQRGSNDLWQFFKHFLLFLGRCLCVFLVVK